MCIIRRLVYGVVVCMLLIALAGCQEIKPPSKITPESVTGLWVEYYEYPEGNKYVHRCAYFRFYADGRFEGHNIPMDYFCWNGYIGENASERDVSGTWRLFDPSKDMAAGGYDLSLEFDSSLGDKDCSYGKVLFPSNQQDVFETHDESPMAVFQKKAQVDCE